MRPHSSKRLPLPAAPLPVLFLVDEAPERFLHYPDLKGCSPETVSLVLSFRLTEAVI